MADAAFITAAGGREPDLEVRSVRGLDDYRAQLDQVAERRLGYERLICRLGDGLQAWELPGWCRVCNQAVSFGVDWSWSWNRTVNFRERLVCPQCGLNNRQRFAAALLQGLIERSPDRIRIYLYEQVTDFYRVASGLAAEVIGSEYLGNTLRSGEVVEGIRHEDALDLSFDDASLDCIFSNDVYEHVPDIDRSLVEAARVLAPSGSLVFSVPFNPREQATRQRARLDGGEIVHLMEPVVHDNPMSGEGSLVFFDYGWDLLERCRAAGFQDAYMLAYYSVIYGHIGGGMQFLFVAER
jgi:SAM-dependent methyltransferase